MMNKFCCLTPLFVRDNVEWSEEQEAAARRKVQEHSQPLPADKQGEIPCESYSPISKY